MTRPIGPTPGASELRASLRLASYPTGWRGRSRPRPAGDSGASRSSSRYPPLETVPPAEVFERIVTGAMNKRPKPSGRQA